MAQGGGGATGANSGETAAQARYKQKIQEKMYFLNYWLFFFSIKKYFLIRLKEAKEMLKNFEDDGKFLSDADSIKKTIWNILFKRRRKKKKKYRKFGKMKRYVIFFPENNLQNIF